MAHENPIISKIKLPNNETPYEICDKQAVHQDELEVITDNILEAIGQKTQVQIVTWEADD